MADTAAEQVQNMNIQEFDGSDFDPFSAQSNMTNVHQNGDQQQVDLLGDLGDVSNGIDKHVSIDPEAGIGLPNPDFFDQQQDPFEGQNSKLMNRNMSEGEVLGYNNEYGESIVSGQTEYHEDDDENNLVDIRGTDVDQGQYNNPYSDSQIVPPDGADSQNVDPSQQFYDENEASQNIYEDNVENDYVGNEGDQSGEYTVEYEDDNIDPNEWQPHMDPERSRRSQSPSRSMSPSRAGLTPGGMDSDRYRRSKSPERSMSPLQAGMGQGCLEPERSQRSETPERSMSPNLGTVSESQGQSYMDSDMLSSPFDASECEAAGGSSAPISSIPVANAHSHPRSFSAQPLSSETESLDSRSETEGTPKRSRIGIAKSRMKKPMELPPWDDNVVIPPPPRMKPTLIGKQADLPPLSPQSIRRPKTAPARHSAKDGSSDSGVEDDKMARSPSKSSADSKKRYGVDSKNSQYRPGGGNIQVFSQKVGQRSVAPRTDTSKPKSSLTSPRDSPARERMMSPKPSPNTKQAQSKIGSLNNVKHAPGGGNVKVLNAKVDFSNVGSKVGSKDKIDHKPKGGDKKILDQKIEVKAQSKVGSTVNMKHKPGGGDKKIETQKLEFKDSAKSKVGSMDKVKHVPGGGDIRILDEKVEFKDTAKSKVGSMDKVKHQPGGGDKKIETQKLSFKETAKPRTNTGTSSGEKVRSPSNSTSRSESVTSQEDHVQG